MVDIVVMSIPMFPLIAAINISFACSYGIAEIPGIQESNTLTAFMNFFSFPNGVERLVKSTDKQVVQLDLKIYNNGNSFPSIDSEIPPVWIALRQVSSLEEVLRYEQREVFSICKKVFEDFPYETPSSLIESEPELCNYFNEYGNLALELKKLIFKLINRESNVVIYEKRGEIILRGLFELFMDEKFNRNGILLPEEYRIDWESDKERNIIDYLSGMMDLYTVELYEKYFGTNKLNEVYMSYKEKAE